MLKKYNIIWNNIDLDKWREEYLLYYQFLDDFFKNKRVLKINICNGNNKENSKTISKFLNLHNITIIKKNSNN